MKDAKNRLEGTILIGGCPKMPFSPNSALCSKNYPRRQASLRDSDINYMSAVIF